MTAKNRQAVTDYMQAYSETMTGLRKNGPDNGSLGAIRHAAAAYAEMIERESDSTKWPTLAGQQSAYLDYLTLREHAIEKHA